MRCFILTILATAVSVMGALAQPTWSKDVARITQAKCQQCHRAGDIAPFELKTYADASTWAEDIKRVVESRQMPPWKPVAGYGSFKHSFALTDEERQTILDWIAGGIPEGDPADLPEPLAETGEFVLGEPDQVVSMAKPFDVPRGRDLYRCFALPLGLTEDAYVEAVQVVPGNRKIVHHVILYLDRSGESEKLDGKDGYPGYDCFGGPGVPLSSSAVLGTWTPGQRPQRLPEGIGIYLNSKSRVVMQVHYFPGGTPGPDQTKVGIYYSKAPVNKRFLYLPIWNDRFNIPAGNAEYDVKQAFPILPLLDMTAYTIIPHMHLLGSKIKLELQQRDGTTEPLIYIDKWDFNWQGEYSFTTPIRLKALSTLRLTCTYDNSESNPKNPSNPLKNVKWGEGTEDEMCIAGLGVTLDNDNLINLLPFRKPTPPNPAASK